MKPRNYYYGGTPLERLQREMDELFATVEPDSEPIQVDVAKAALYADKDDVEREVSRIKNKIESVQAYEKCKKIFEAYVNYERAKENRMRRIEDKLDILLKESERN